MVIVRSIAVYTYK